MSNTNIQTLPVQKINPAPYNPRKDLQPGDPEYEKLKQSIQQFGCVQVLVWNQRTGYLVGGHQTFKVLLDLGHEEVQVSVVDLDETSEKALNIALNKICGDWDEEALAFLLDELRAAGAEGLTGFDEEEIDKLIAQFDAGPEETTDDFENNEISLGSFDDDKFAHTCPRCGFSFNEKGEGSDES